MIACRKGMPDLPELAKYMQAAHAELVKLTPAASVAVPTNVLALKPARATISATGKRVANTASKKSVRKTFAKMA